MTLKSLIKLAIVCSSLSYCQLSQQQNALALSDEVCKFETQKSYEHTHEFGGTHKGTMTFDTSKQVNGNGKLVTIFSGKWRLGTSSDYDEVDVQTQGSIFTLVRHMDGGISQMWIGTCESNGYVRGSVTDPTVGKGSFSVKFQ